MPPTQALSYTQPSEQEHALFSKLQEEVTATIAKINENVREQEARARVHQVLVGEGSGLRGGSLAVSRRMDIAAAAPVHAAATGPQRAARLIARLMARLMARLIASLIAALWPA